MEIQIDSTQTINCLCIGDDAQPCQVWTSYGGYADEAKLLELATENWISSKLQRVEALLDQPQNSSIFPECTDEELWATDEVFKYYKNPTKTDRSTKNFATMDEALQRKSQDGDVGMIRTVPGEVKACRYCSVVEICKQAQDMQMSGRLHL